jgi:drug/metabolite transporter (DMT)-like permease
MGSIDVFSLEKKMELLMNRYFILVLCVLATSFGNVLFKTTANILKTHNSIVLLAFEPAFIAALIIYGITTLGWIWCLQDIPLSRAYLFMSLAYVFIPALSWMFFGEIPKLQYILSTFLIISGIVCAVV